MAAARVTLGRLCAAALLLALVPATAAASVPAPNPLDHGFVPVLKPDGQVAPAPASPAGVSGDSETLIYHGGAVSPSSTVYAIFWDPPGSPGHFAQGYKNLISAYFVDLAAASGHPTNTNEIAQQYTDTLGGGHRASYAVRYGGSFDETTPYPTSGQCVAPNGDSVCLNDDSTHNQIQHEVTSFANTHGLPIDLTHVYFVFTPAGVSSCDGADSCSYESFCAYHRFSDAPGVPLYTNQPDDAVPACGGDLDRPNHNDADSTLSAVAHEHIETLTDPQGTAWWDAGGDEIGDICAYTYGAELGGPDGAQYNQLINGHPYQLQQEYSNALGDCMSSVPLSAGIAGAAPHPATAGVPVSLDGSASSETGGTIASYSWDFGDGSPIASGASATASHTYSAPGTYAVRLNVADSDGFSDYQTASVTVSPGATSTTIPPPGHLRAPPTARLSLTSAHPATGEPIGFSASRSSAGSGPLSYSWNFGDGSAPASGAAPRHIYRKPGGYTVTLTVTDRSGLRSSATMPLTVALAGRITRILTRRSGTREFLLVELNAPGMLSVGTATVRARTAHRYSFKIDLNRGQLRRLGARHKLIVRLKLRYVPDAGRPTVETVAVTLRR